jgi:protein-S-isoprenylcysteine O-methyltransferase Ste14
MSQIQLIFERQWLHALILAILLTGAAMAANLDGMKAGMLWGISTDAWFWLAIALAITHQVYIWFCWRIQLNGNCITRIFGNMAFPVYAVIFFLLGAFRVAVVFVLAISNRNTVPMDITILRTIAIVMLILATYLLYSVARYFSFRRAMGIDHFNENYRMLPLVRKGIFRFTRNGMYTYGFLFLWVPALWWASAAAMCAALFNHIYIWVHYFSTELPDMKRIYGKAKLTAHD